MRVLIRCSTEERILRLQKEGQIFCKSIQYFATQPEEDGVGDKYENIFEQQYYKDGNMKITFAGGEKVEFKTYARFCHLAKEHYTNIYCLYALDSDDYQLGEEIHLPQQFKDMGQDYTHIIVIYNEAEFFKRIKIAANKRKIPHKTANIDYVDFSTYTGKKDEFQKPIRLKYQNEVRVAFQTNSLDDFELFIGNIEDISTVCLKKDMTPIVFNYQ